MVLIHDIQKDHVSNMVYHVDFLAIDKNQKVQTYVPLRFVGESVVEKNGLGRIQYVKDTILVEALPADLPHDIEVDVSGIQTLNDSVFVSDLKIEGKVLIKEDMDSPLVVAVEITEEKEETTSTSETSDTSTQASSESK
jgi:large subunit ribosomal protein L25